MQTSYHKPCFLLYLTHSGFIFIFPVRLLTLRLSGKSPARIRVLLEQLGATLKAHLLEQRRGGVKQPRQPRKGLETLAQDGEGDDDEDEDEEDDIDPEVRDGPFPHGYFLATILISTLLITFPALSWYLAVALTNPTIVTALFNTNALWALVLAHYLLEPKGTPWKRSTLLSVLCAVLGVFVIAWGDYVRDPAPAPQEVAEEETGAGSHLAGSFLALLGSFGYALYEVSYKWKMALPEPHDGAAVEPAPDAVKLASAPQSPVADRTLSLPDAGDTPSRPLLYNTPRRPSARPVSMVSRPSLSSLLLPDHVNRPVDLAHISPTIFLLHADLITTLIGLTTVLLLWIPLPLLNALGWEVWESPFGKGISLEIIGMVAMGVVLSVPSLPCPSSHHLTLDEQQRRLHDPARLVGPDHGLGRQPLHARPRRHLRSRLLPLRLLPILRLPLHLFVPSRERPHPRRVRDHDVGDVSAQPGLGEGEGRGREGEGGEDRSAEEQERRLWALEASVKKFCSIQHGRDAHDARYPVDLEPEQTLTHATPWPLPRLGATSSGFLAAPHSLNGVMPLPSPTAGPLPLPMTSLLDRPVDGGVTTLPCPSPGLGGVPAAEKDRLVPDAWVETLAKELEDETVEGSDPDRDLEPMTGGERPVGEDLTDVGGET